MATKTEYDFYKRLLNSSLVTLSSVPKSITTSSKFIQLRNAGILIDEKAGKGRIIKVDKIESYQSFFYKNFPEENEGLNTKTDSIKLLRDSKKLKIETSKAYYLLRGNQNLIYDSEVVNIGEFTSRFGAFVINDLSKLNCDSVAIIENKYFFEKAFSIISNNFICIHKYGRWSKEDFKNLHIKGEILFCGDYDLVGLDEYLKFKEVKNNVKLFIPDNFDDIFEKYGKKFDGKTNFNQNLTTRIKNSTDPIVMKIKNMVLRNNSFLEQEALL